MRGNRPHSLHRAALAIFLLACASTCAPEGPGAPEAGDEEKSIQVTVWSERLEAFVEYPPPVAGSLATFATHVTDLQTSEPRRAGSARFVLRKGSGAPLEHLEPAPARAGIYVARLVFPEAGRWSVTLQIPDLDASVDLPEVAVHASWDEAVSTPVPDAPEGISFLKEQQWRFRTRADVVEKRSLVERVRLPATVRARPRGRASVHPPVAGRVLAPPGGEVPAIGTRVAKGEVLALVEPPFSDLGVRIAEAEAEVLRAAADLERAERIAERVRALAEEKARPEREAEDAEFEARLARATHEGALAVRDSYRKAAAAAFGAPPGDSESPFAFALRSPIDGIVTAVGIAVGEFVAPERPLLTILDAGTVLVEARVSESDLGRLGPSRDALYATPDAPDRFVPILGEDGGRFLLLGPEVDPKTRTVPLVYEVPNPDGRLRIGMALDVYVETGRVEASLAVPASALVEEGGRPVAFVQLAGETFEKRDVETGLRDGEFVQILSGLAEGERAVTRGATAIRLASASGAIPAHGHEH